MRVARDDSSRGPSVTSSTSASSATVTDAAIPDLSTRIRTPAERLLGRLVDVRADEMRAMLLACVYFFFLLSSYFILRPIRDALGVAAGVSQLPWLFVGTLSATLICQPLFAMLVARFPARRFIPITYQFFALNLLLFWLALHHGAGAQIGRDVWVGRAFFVWTSVFNLFVVSVFWCFMADVFRSEQAKRLFGFIGVGGTLGSLAGSAVTASLAERIGTVNLLLISLVLLELATVVVLVFPRGTVARAAGVRSAADARKALRGEEPAPANGAAGAESAEHDRPIGGSAWSGIANVLRSRYLLGIAAFLVLYTIGSTFLYFQQADIIGAEFVGREARTQILAKMEFAASLLTVFTQLFFTGRIIRTIGLAATLALMPAISILGFSAIGLSAFGLVPTLGAFVVFNVLRRGSNFALTNPAMEVLFTVVPREDKYKAKSFIETFVYRSGDQIAAWTYAGLAAIGMSRTALAWPAAALSALFLVVGIWLGRRQTRLAREHA
jgi:AAA family ATP:ADP antiporter